MALTHIIAHRIERQNPDNTATLHLKDQSWSHNGRIEECFRELKHAMIKRLGKEYGRFSSDLAAHPLSNWLKEYTEEKISFDRFTQKAMEHMKVILENTEVGVDGFVFFAYEHLESAEFLHVFFVQHNTGQYIDGEMSINDSFYLDTSGIRLAAKINITDWQSNDDYRSSNAITLLRWKGEKDLTDVFVEFVGLSEKVDVSTETEEFLNIVSDYTKDLPEAAAYQTKKQVVNYCLEQDKMGESVKISDLSTQLKEQTLAHATDENDGNNEAKDLPEFATFVSQNQPSGKPELIPDTSQLRQYVRISGRNERMSMSFQSSCLGDTVVYDAASDSLTIKDIPPALKARLTKHIQKNN